MNGLKEPCFKIMCIVYTIRKTIIASPLSNRRGNLGFDGVIVMSDKSDSILGTINIPYEGNEEYNHIWQKI